MNDKIIDLNNKSEEEKNKKLANISKKILDMFEQENKKEDTSFKK